VIPAEVANAPDPIVRLELPMPLIQLLGSNGT
jgi:hypothetical protein